MIAGQKFQIEWVTGHDADVYFTLLAEENHMRNMLNHKREMLDDYLNNAPTNQRSPPNREWQKYHRKYKSTNLDNTSGDKFFAEQINYGEPDYIERSDAFEGRFSGAPSKPADRDVKLFNQMVFKQTGSCVEDDRRVVYNNAKYPWVIAMHRYRICTGQVSIINNKGQQLTNINKR